jgi:hypothetical protein
MAAEVCEESRGLTRPRPFADLEMQCVHNVIDVVFQFAYKFYWKQQKQRVKTTSSSCRETSRRS